MAQGVNGFYFISIGAEEEKEFPLSLSDLSYTHRRLDVVADDVVRVR